MLIGGTAVALNGYYTISINIKGEMAEKTDIDMWYNPTHENYFNIIEALTELGHDTSEVKKEKSPNPRRSFFKIDLDNFTLDILPKIKANIKFSVANRRKETVLVEGTPIHFMNFYDLIEDKEALARKKDLEDVQQLKKIKNQH